MIDWLLLRSHCEPPNLDSVLFRDTQPLVLFKSFSPLVVHFGQGSDYSHSLPAEVFFQTENKSRIFGFFLSFLFEIRITVIKTRRLRNTWGVLEVAQAGSLLVVMAGDTTHLWKLYCVQLMDSALASPGRQALPDSKFLCSAKDW